MAEEVGPGPGTGTNPGAATPATTTPSTPSFIELSDDSLIKPPGAKDPVKYGEWNRGFKSELTRKSQELAKIGPELKRLKDLEQEWKRREALITGRPEPKADPSAELLSKIGEMGFLDGKSAREVVSYLQGQIGRFGSELSQRDQILLGMARYVASMQETVKSLAQQRSENEQRAKITNILKEHDLGDEWRELAEDLYAAYEGEDLDQEIPKILKSRIEQAEKAIRSRERRLREERAKTPFVPGKGGTGVAGKPIKEGFKSPADVAKEFFAGRRGEFGDEE